MIKDTAYAVQKRYDKIFYKKKCIHHKKVIVSKKLINDKIFITK
jgi:hypothetical protein